MRKLLLLLLPLLAAFSLGCIGSHSKLAPCPTPSGAPATFQPPPPPPSQSPEEDISDELRDGAKLLVEHYVDKLDLVTLLQAAWDGTRDELNKHSVTIPDSIDPNR